MSHFSKILLAALTAPTFAVVASAQVTTSSINGQVFDENNQPVVGAAIVAVHTPSGTRYRAMTNNDGRYTIQGMRTGGPYTVTVSYLGYATRTYEKLYLELGNSLPINVEMTPRENTLGEATVTGVRKQKGGASSNFSLSQIQSVPTVDRNVYDLVKNSPMAMSNKDGGISFAGSNNRYNSFQIDGVVSNDVFGLTSSGTNGGQSGANPISMDAIEEIQVVVAPFDVRQSGFTGGAINAVTKQGTNTTHATAYTYFNNQNMYGKYSALNGYDKIPMTQQFERTFGGTLGGAFIKDKLFYFVSAEAKKQSYPVNIYPGYAPTYLSAATAKQIADQYEALTGHSEGYGQRNVDKKSFGLLARVDWNIDEKNKLSLRFQHQNAFDDKYGAGTSSYTFNNSSYRMNNKTNSIVAELNSHLSDEFYNEFRGSATFVRDHRDVAYQGPTVQIYNLPSADGTINNITGNVGTDYSSGANMLDQDIYSIEDNLSWYKGNHTMTFGTHNEFYRMKNLFIQASNGSWYYDSLDEFLADAPSKFTYKYTDPEVTGGDTKYAPSLKSGQFGFYAQDKWSPNRNFNLTYGLRFDIPVMFNSPTTNEEFNTWAAERNMKQRVGEMPGAKVLVSPRLGFNWYTDDSHNTLLRGGVGIFTGRVPFVWLSNAYNNTGVEAKGTTISRGDIPKLGQYAGNPLQALTDQAGAGSAAKPDIVTINDDYKFPQALRANLALEQVLPGDVKFTLEGVYSKTLNNVFFENLALTNAGDAYAVPGVEASKAPYYTTEASNYYSIINLKNTNKGYTYAISAQLQKSFDFGLDLSASYTFSRAKSVNDGKSSVASSNWKKNFSVDTNSDKELGFSKFDIPHRLLLTVSYTSPKYLNGWTSTTVALTYNAFSGSRYSLTISDATKTDFNGDGASGNSLLYIPTAEQLELMKFKTEDDKTKFANWIERDDYAKNHRGQYAERNSNLSKWEHQIDLHLAQDFYNLKGIGKLQFTFDIVNFTNMLNKKWGANYDVDWSYSPLKIASLDKQTVDGRTVVTPTYTYNSNNAPSKKDVYSRWHAQVGIRLSF